MSTTADYLNQLIDDRNDLADNLVTMGVVASHSETFTELVPKVLDISGGSNIGYEVKFTVEGNDYYVASCQQGESISEPPTPTSQLGYFNAWQLNGVDVAFPYTPSADAEVVAVFSTIPAEYHAIAYLEAAGNQSIDTGLTIANNSYFELSAAFTQNVSNNTAYGLGYASKECNVISTGGGIYNQIGGVNIGISHDTNDHIFKADASHIYIDSTTGNPNWNNIPTGQRLRLFAVAYNGSFSSSRISYAKIYYCKMWQGDTLVRDFVPVRRIADSVGGMWDYINEVFYTNDGSGSFINGPDV